MMGRADIDDYLDKLKSGMNELVDTLTIMMMIPIAPIWWDEVSMTPSRSWKIPATTAELAIMVDRLGRQMEAIMGDLKPLPALNLQPGYRGSADQCECGIQAGGRC